MLLKNEYLPPQNISAIWYMYVHVQSLVLLQIDMYVHARAIAYLVHYQLVL